MKKTPSDPRVRDTYDVGYVRRYRELNKWRGTVLPWVGLAAVILGFILLAIAYVSWYDNTPKSLTYKTPTGQTAVLESGYITIGDTVFTLRDGGDSTNVAYRGTVTVAFALLIIGLFLILGHFGWWITEKSKEAAWDMVEQVHGFKKED